MSLSDYAENKVVDHSLGTSAWTMPTGVYVKLHTGDPGEAGTANASAETTRVEITFGAASGGTATSSNTPTWSTWSAGSETLTHISLWDASTAGNCLYTAALTASKAVANGDDFELSSSTVTVS